jgi:hypothetical protein
VLLQEKPLSPKDPRALYLSSFLAGADEFVSEHRSGVLYANAKHLLQEQEESLAVFLLLLLC